VVECGDSNTGGTMELGYIYIGLWALGVIVAIAWIIMPFAIIGTKPILRSVLTALEENNRLMREMSARSEPPTKPLYVPGAHRE
jgi:hypothetical protein